MKWFWFIICSICIISAGNIFACQAPTSRVSYVTSLIKSGSSVATAVRKKFQIEHSKILLEIKNNFNIPDSLWRATINPITLLKIRDKNRLMLSQDTPACSCYGLIQNRAQEMLQGYGINPAWVDIQLTYKTIASPAQAMQKIDPTHSFILHSLGINIPHFSMLSNDAQEALLMHEGMHLIQYDSFEESYILGLLQARGFKPEYYNNHPSLIKYRHHIEMRADAYAALASPQAAYKLLNNICPLLNMQCTPTHPARAERYWQLKELAELLEIEQCLKSA